ncbi:MAG: hypothetical protein LC768_13555 [Acidobacteria bacterium]|nr:hypothetical protein [Acidobacteriota bacterium]
MTNSNPKESVRKLLTEIIDYAGLFPPSQLSMSEAVSNYANYKNSNYNWMLGRFVAPVSRLEEFLESAQDFFSKDGKDVWHLSVLAGEDIYETVSRIKDFNTKNTSFAVCDVLEVKADTSPLIKNISEATLPDLATYVELPLNENLADLISTLSINRLRGKIRTGGTTAEAFPSTREIIRFVRTCLAADVPFKATAGLHHPIRCLKPLTYETDAPEGTMNGFLNLFLAAGFASEGFKASVLEELMEDEFSESFEFNENGISWRQEYFLSNAQLARLRQQNIVSFGSCSFTEPIEDLQEIGVL